MRRAAIIVGMVVALGIVVSVVHRHEPASAPSTVASVEAPPRHRRVAGVEAPPRHRRAAVSRSPRESHDPARYRVIPPEPDEERLLLDSLSEAVIVQHYDGTVGVYAPEDWPIDGDGIIVARKRDGEILWYAGPDAGERSDPDAFAPVDPPEPRPASRWVREPDGTITINGVPASPAVQSAFGGR